MNVVAWIVTGIFAGWLANRFLNKDSKDSRLIFIVAGVLGAFTGVQLLSPASDAATVDTNAFSVPLMFYSAVGAAALLVIGNLLRQKFFP